MINLVNFRDLGGMKTADGRRVKMKRILRSGEVVKIGREDTEILLNDYQLKQIIDFRGTKECSERPDDTFDMVQYYNIDIMKEIKHSTSMESMVRNSVKYDADEQMKEVYRNIGKDAFARSGYQQFVRLLLGLKQGSSLFHCFAGKDRTGIGAAIILSILGVSKDDIFEDFLKTNKQREAANQWIIDDAQKQGYNDKQLETLLRLMCVDAGYLEELYQTIDEDYGTFNIYIKQGLGISQSEVESLQNLYLE